MDTNKYLNPFDSMVRLGEYFNNGDGKDASPEVKEAWEGIRNFVTIALQDLMEHA